MVYIDTELYEHFFTNVDQMVHRIVTSTSQELQHQLSDPEYDLHYDLLHHLFLKIKEELDDHHLTAAINLDYDPANVLSEQGYDLDDIVMLLSHFRLNAIKEIEKEFQKFGVGSLKDAFYFMHRMSDVFDQVMKNSTAHYNNQYQLNLQKLEEEVMLLSAPIVPVKEGISVLPIIGSLNEERASHIIQNVVPEVAESNVEILIIDFSGIHQFDTYVARRLVTITRMIQLLGIRVVMTGIRPDMAQTTIELWGVLDNIETYRDVKKALERLGSF